MAFQRTKYDIQFGTRFFLIRLVQRKQASANEKEKRTFVIIFLKVNVNIIRKILDHLKCKIMKFENMSSTFLYFNGSFDARLKKANVALFDLFGNF